MGIVFGKFLKKERGKREKKPFPLLKQRGGVRNRKGSEATEGAKPLWLPIPRQTVGSYGRGNEKGRNRHPNHWSKQRLQRHEPLGV